MVSICHHLECLFDVKAWISHELLSRHFNLCFSVEERLPDLAKEFLSVVGEQVHVLDLHPYVFGLPRDQFAENRLTLWLEGITEFRVLEGLLAFFAEASEE
jgi:hypothetical protein